MIMALVGIALIGAILALFYLKDRLESPLLARMAYHELTMRLTVVGAALVALGLLMMASDWIGWP